MNSKCFYCFRVYYQFSIFIFIQVVIISFFFVQGFYSCLCFFWDFCCFVLMVVSKDIELGLCIINCEMLGEKIFIKKILKVMNKKRNMYLDIYEFSLINYDVVQMGLCYICL